MRRFNRCIPLYLLITIALFSSCNVSFDILKRKYRPGYSISLFHNQSATKHATNEDELIDSLEVSGDTAFIENSVVCSTNDELFLKKELEMVSLIPCDTPPLKKMDDPNWTLYNKKKVPEGSTYKGRLLEPYGLLAIIFLALGFFITALLEYLSIWIFLFVFFSVFVMSLISLIKMKKEPGKYMRVFRLTDWIFLSFYIILTLVGLFTLGSQ